jgi:hypothetical protein
MFERLKHDSTLVKNLKDEKWWRNLVELSHTDRDINIQIRPDSINVYSKMGNLLRISLNRGQVICEVHYKFLISALKSPYVKISPESGLLKVEKGVCPSVKDILSKESLKVIKQNISKYAGEEKKIQSTLVEKNKDTTLDVEVAFSGGTPTEEEEKKDARIDFVNYDKKYNKIVFIELKQIFDERLYRDEINAQIKKYYDFARNNSQQIIDAYNECLQTKKELGIIRETDFLGKVIISELEPKPILAIAAYNQKIIDALKETILKKLNTEYLAGIYFFGTVTDLNLGKGRNRFLYK